MDFTLTPQEEAFKKEVNDWLDEHMKELPDWYGKNDGSGPDPESDEYRQFSAGWHKKLYDAGARACLLRFETANKELFEKMRPGTSLEERLELIRYAKELGYVLATGFISGLPGETPEDAADNILLSRSLGPHMYSFGPLVPSEGTPLAGSKRPGTQAVLRQIAATRLLDRDSNILVTTALETIDPDAKKLGLLAGGNSLMINATPDKYKHLYRIYDNKAGNDKGVEENINETIELLYSLGRAPTDLGL